MATPLHPASTVRSRTLKARRPHFEFPDRLPVRHFVQGDLLLSHLVVVMSTLIPEGERWVIEVVKRYRDDIDDVDLRRQANAFIGQETTHQREHENLNRTLRRMGYPVGVIELLGRPFFGVARRLPRERQLALTAAIEHWTAVLAEQVLSHSPQPDPEQSEAEAEERLLRHDEFVAMVIWHLIEEIEHKSVAFDIMQALGTTEDERIATMRLFRRLAAPMFAAGMAVSMATDPAAWNPRNIRRSLRSFKTDSALGQRSFMDAIREWDSEGFHPDQRDHGALLERWRTEAFGPGSIVDQRTPGQAA